VTSAGPHLFWITSRAAGTAALVLASASVGAGLLIGGRGEGSRRLGADARPLHEALSLATLAAVAVHGLALLGDHYLHPGVLQISIPFTSAYRPFWTGIGIVAGWGMAALGLSYYARGRIGQARWRSLHRFTAVFWGLGILHTIGAGTDAWQLWFLLLIGAPMVPALVLLMAKFSRSGGEGDPPSANRRRARTPPQHPDLALSGREG
jgi:methionine sulfoxide reductase heme-binding subunit